MDLRTSLACLKNIHILTILNLSTDLGRGLKILYNPDSIVVEYVVDMSGPLLLLTWNYAVSSLSTA